MLKKKEAELLFKIICLGLIIITLVFSSLAYYQTNQKFRAVKLASAKIETSLKQEINDLREIVTALTNGNEQLAQNLEAERIKREESEITTQASNKKLAEISAGLDASDITRLISEWNPRVVKLECVVEFADKTTKKSTASGVVNVSDAVTKIYTSKHVVEEKGVLAKDCRVVSSDVTTKFATSNITIDANIDLAYLNFTKILDLPGGVSLPVKKCAQKPILGDQVVILGYPSVGSTNGVTATEGIISGFDKEYYITSAKIERGNSGGAAILVKNNCLLGLPTLVVAGQIESLARILAL
ncbi:MAG: hypothetical protein A2571_02355 [Candidatus Vogelbacteria bacterium RIFOXYD1_FULL_44_32]|uniref:Serine protease n=1 Tax=Candidatus Vogelbacteria bacterium RIFOXYD1_FULL_44_32 TaxID=1802438 RepID=A0A1G2QET7_9BACT|nr:MAG: hypothetical protein A2571_02355 [Candidatus Vogelbacteria bacterium RIFOXYD1_FULL_44_32]